MTLPDVRVLLGALARADVEDLVRTLAGVPAYAALAADADRYEIEGNTLLAASSQQLMAMKRVRGSAQDHADIETLRLLQAQDPT